MTDEQANWTDEQKKLHAMWTRPMLEEAWQKALREALKHLPKEAGLSY